MTKNTPPTPEPAEPAANRGTGLELITKLGKRFGLLAFFFFLAKGLAWLMVPTALAWVATR